MREWHAFLQTIRWWRENKKRAMVARMLEQPFTPYSGYTVFLFGAAWYLFVFWIVDIGVIWNTGPTGPLRQVWLTLAVMGESIVIATLENFADMVEREKQWQLL